MSLILAHLVVVGFDEIVSDKYLSCIKEAVDDKFIDGYSIIDIEPERNFITERLKDAPIQPENIYYLPDRRSHNNWADNRDIQIVFEKLSAIKVKLIVYIATELKAHENYLRFCVENDIDSLVEKPVLSPLSDGKFNPSLISSTITHLIERAQKGNAKHSVMTLSRYHKIYNDQVLNPLKEMVLKLQAPVTSFHIRVAGGVWNLHHEYESREDHPYKYGYGMLMHGAYHYIDLASQFLSLNKLIYPNEEFFLSLSSYVAFPFDQNDRISKKFSASFNDNIPNWESNFPIGETDITTAFSLKRKASNKIITLGTMSFEQTTPSYRAWQQIPENLYNKNGRLSSVDIEAQLATLHSVHVNCYDNPLTDAKNTIDSIDGYATIVRRNNASLLEGEKFIEESTFKGVFHRDSNRDLIRMWVRGKENKSSLESHLLVMQLTQALAESIRTPGEPINFTFN
jgi:predicted dehydrogenase